MYGIHEQTGKANSVSFNSKPRKCKMCKKKLSLYNLNEYCFAHVRDGDDMERREAEVKKEKQYTKNLKRMKKVRDEANG